MTIVAVSKNKRSQPIFRTTPPLRDQIIVVFGGAFEVNDLLFEASIMDDSPAFTVDEDGLEFEVLEDVNFSVPDPDTDLETC